ncbi:MAG: PKD domain-containing protein, partial [Candidatus Omnitrophica bacterium]|nr:PKD domain-containing protein [Candidatus Omnitrophota bacterium]
MKTIQTPNTRLKFYLNGFSKCFLIMLLGILFSTSVVDAESRGIWISQSELMRIPITGEIGCAQESYCAEAWDKIEEAAAKDVSQEDVDLGDSKHKVAHTVYAKAIVLVRKQQPQYLEQILNILNEMIGTENETDLAVLVHNLPLYVITADLIDLPQVNSSLSVKFRNWLVSLGEGKKDANIYEQLKKCHETQPNDQGALCGAARLAIAAYLGDQKEIERVENIYRRWTEVIHSDNKFDYDNKAYSWTTSNTNRSHKKRFSTISAINPADTSVKGYSVDGVIIAAQDDADPKSFHWPPNYTPTVYGALAGVTLQAEMLSRLGYDDVWQRGDAALKRAVDWMFLEEDGKESWDTCEDKEHDKTFVLDLIDKAYDTDFVKMMLDQCEANFPSQPGLNMAWTSWTHSEERIVEDSSEPECGNKICDVGENEKSCRKDCEEDDNEPPVAKIKVMQNSGLSPLTVLFSSEGSKDEDGLITQTKWEFGDGSESTNASPVYVYENPGEYKAKLEVTDDDGSTNVDTIKIKVLGSQFRDDCKDKEDSDEDDDDYQRSYRNYFKYRSHKDDDRNFFRHKKRKHGWKKDHDEHDDDCMNQGFCGNGVIDALEECDDNNTLGGDGCSPRCLIEACGNGRVDVEEECDDGNVIDG